MDFTFPEELNLLREMVRDFARNEIAPRIDEMEEKEEIPKDLIDQMAELGFFGIMFPEEYGGSGMGKLGYCIMQEEISRVHASTSVLIGASEGLAGGALFLDGTEEQKKKYLTGIAEGKLIGAYALTEPNAGSDAGSIRTSAVKDGNEWVINGRKIFITNGAIADIVIVYAVTDKTLGPKGGITAFIVETDWKGFSVGKLEDKMGIRATTTAELIFEDLRVPEENVLGQVGIGFKNALNTLDYGRLTLACGCLGAAKEAVDIAYKYAKERQQFGQPIANFQTIQNYLAEMVIDTFAIESMTYRVAWMADQGMDIIREASIVKNFASEVSDRVIDKALQIHGGYGYIKDFPIERMYRDSRINRIFEGTNEIQKYIIYKTLERKGRY